MRRLSPLILLFFFFFFFHSWFFFSSLDSPFLSSAFCSSVVCRLSLLSALYACIRDCQRMKKKKRCCGTNLNWALCCTLSCSMLSSCRKMPSLPVCVPFFQLSLRAAPCGGMCVCACPRVSCMLSVCMWAECATCSVPSHSSVNVVAWLQQYLLYSYYFYYCGCLVKPDIITPVELFNCVVEHCS